MASVVGFGSAWTRGDDWFLACLFVRGRAQGRGVGPALLEAVWGDARRRRTVTDAIQPVSNVLYGRRGLVPATPLLTFSGVPRIDAHAEEAPADVAAIDAVAYGFDRTVDHRYWELHARRTEWGDAYSYVFPGGDIGPVAGATPAAAARALAAELARSDGPVRVRIPGSARELVEVALRHSFASARCRGSCCSRPASSRRRRSHLRATCSSESTDSAAPSAGYTPRMSGEAWGFVFLMLALKIPIVYLGVVVWYAIKAEPEPGVDPSRLLGLAALAAARRAAPAARQPARNPRLRSGRARGAR